MTEITSERLSHHSLSYPLCLFLVVSASFIGWLPLAKAQQVDVIPSSNSAQPLPAGSDADHQKLIQIRAQAQQARREAQLAALQRSATQSTDKSNRDLILQKSRTDKEFKRRAALAVQQQQAINAYEKVKQSQIDSWNGKGKKPKISSGVPADFTASLPPLEEESGKRKGLLSGVVSAPGKALKGLSSLRPGFLGGKKKNTEISPEPAAQFAPPESLRLDAVAPPAPEPTTEAESVQTSQSEKSGFRIPLISKLTGGKKQDANPYEAEENEPLAQAPQDSTDPAASDAPPEKKNGFFKGIASHIPLVGNKDKAGDDNPYAYESSDGEGEMENESKSGFLSKLPFKKQESDNLETDNETQKEKSGSRNDIYLVNSNKAQFFPFGKSGRQAGSQPLSEGTIVRITKSGDDWSSIELSSGSMGVMRNKHLRRAKSGEVPAKMFAHKPKTPYPTTARISKARSATGKGSAHRYREPVNVPLPDLPAGGAESDTPIGNGLLPPLEANSTLQ